VRLSSRFSPNGMGADHPQISLAHLPPSQRQTRSALAGAAVLLLGLAVLAPFAGKPLPRVNGFIPAFDAIISVTDLITAGLLLAQFSITRLRAIWALACGYLFSAAIVVAHALTFPGAFSPTGDFGVKSHINFRVYLLWHLGLPVAIFAYIWLREKAPKKAGVQRPTEMAATVAGVAVFALVSCIAWLGLLPPVDPVAGRWFTVVAMLICAAALFVLWLFQRSVLDQWLMVVILAIIIELAITGLIGAIVHRDDMLPIDQARVATLGFYVGRLFSLVTSTVVLIALLAETSKLYAGVARANTLASAVKTSQALSSEVKLANLIERLMKIAIENAGADSGVLIVPSGDEYLIQAKARATSDQIEVEFCQEPITGIACPESLIRHVIRTRERVIVDDASTPNLFSGDDYLRDRQIKSILCLPLIKQSELTGILLLENKLTSHAFTPARIALLELLAGQAAISLENAALYTDLQLQVALLQHLPVSAWTLRPDGTPDFVNQVWLEFAGQTPDFVQSHPEAWMTAVHPEDRETAAKSFWEGVHLGRGFAVETRSLRAQDRTYRWHLQQAVPLRDAEGKVLKFVGTTTDIDDQKHSEEALRQAQSDLARIHRVTTMGELAASLAHEISQPISGAITNANVCLRYLGRDKPDLDGMREVVTRIARDAQRAAEILVRIRSQFQKGTLDREVLDVNEIHRETVALLRDQAVRYNVSVRTEFADDLPQIIGDRVQLQQVAMNLIVNGIEAMKEVDGIREMVIQSQRAENEQIHVSFSDTGIGLSPQLAEQIFDPFFTTKPHGTGMGLRISRSIVESHGGRLWAEAAIGRGATFRLNLPAAIADPK
jgi:PAS domain S-box-containing protein